MRIANGGWGGQGSLPVRSQRPKQRTKESLRERRGRTTRNLNKGTNEEMHRAFLEDGNLSCSIRAEDLSKREEMKGHIERGIRGRNAQVLQGQNKVTLGSY